MDKTIALGWSLLGDRVELVACAGVYYVVTYDVVTEHVDVCDAYAVFSAEVHVELEVAS